MRDEEYLLKKIKDHLEVMFILKLMNFLKSSGVCPETNTQEWLRSLTALHARGWLFYGYEKDEVKAVAGAYRIKEFKNEPIRQLPVRDEGDILYIDFCVSKAQDKNLIKSMLDTYIKKHRLKKIVFFKRNSDEKFKIIDLTRRANNVEETQPTTST